MTEIEKLDEAVGIAIEAQMAEDDNDGPELAKAARTALLSHLAATGWQVVPKVATDVMNEAGNVANETWLNIAADADDYDDAEAKPNAFIYQGMLAAAPKFGGSDG